LALQCGFQPTGRAPRAAGLLRLLTEVLTFSAAAGCVLYTGRCRQSADSHPERLSGLRGGS